MKLSQHFRKLTIRERALTDIEQHRRDLYNANKVLAVAQNTVTFHESEIERLSAPALMSFSVGSDRNTGIKA